MNVDQPCAYLPSDIYDDRKSVRLNAASIEADLRFTNYYMDLQVTISPLKAYLHSRGVNDVSVFSGSQLFVDGVSVHGHRLFGLPPVEPTYVCNWDFEIGRIIGECSTEFLSCLVDGLQNFDLSFDNAENALPPLHLETLHDVTFLRVSVHSVHISVFLKEVAFILSTGLVKAKSNDWADSKFSKRVAISVLDLAVGAVDRQSVDEIRGQEQKVLKPQALFQTAIEVKMAQRKRDIAEHSRLQQEHIKLHDQITHRADWLLFDWHDTEPEFDLLDRSKLHPPNIPVPMMPEPIRRLQNVRRASSGYPSSLKSNASSKSFLYHRDASSPGSVGKRAAHRTSKAEGVSPRETLRCDKGGEKDAPTLAGDLNPWAIPEFSAYQASLDTSRLPQQACDEKHRQDSSARNPLVIRSPFENDEMNQSNIFIHFTTGVKGFFTPQLLLIVSDLLRDFQPTHPVEVIDSLQKDTISHIVGYEKSMNNPKKSTSVAVRVPLILLRFINASGSDSDGQPGFRDEYNINISYLRTEFRSRVARHKDDLIEGIRKSFALHSAAESLSASVEGSRCDASTGKAELKFMLRDMNFWLLTTPAMKSHLQLRSFDAVTSTKSMEHLAFLVRRTTTTIDSVASSFQYNVPRGDERLRLVVYWLTLFSPNIPDPIFLTRVSSVLRVSRSHVRQHDSWKIISRLRHIYKNLQLSQRQELEAKCRSDDLSIPDNARPTALSIFDKWRTWDLAHVAKSYAMQRVWNTPASGQEDGSGGPLALSTTVGSFRFSLDPGPNESDFVVENASTAVNVRSEKVESQKGSNGDKLKTLVIVQSYCASSALRLRWEILDLVEGIARTMSSVTLESTQRPKHSVGQVEQRAASELQVVLGTDVGAITLDGINVKLALVSRALKGSAVSRSAFLDKSDTLSVLLSAGTGLSELSSHSKVLMAWRVWNPYIYCSQSPFERQGAQIINDWKLAGSCRKLRYEMDEDPVGLTHAADRLIEDEVRHVRQLLKHISPPSSSPAPKAEMEQPARHVPTGNRFHVALFLEDYQLKIRLLPTLIYNISGYVSRMSLGPASANSSMIEVDFDLKENFHAFMSDEEESAEVFSTLKMPPINGRVLVRQTIDHTHVEVDTTVELIQLEASALRGLLSIITGSEFSHMVSDVKQNCEVLQRHMDNLQYKKAPSRLDVAPKSRDLLYKARLTVAGMAVHVTAPGTNEKDYSVDMNLGFGMSRMHINNGLERGVPVMFPELSIDISQILLELTRRQRSRSQTCGRFSVDAKFLATSAASENGEQLRAYRVSSEGFNVELFPETAVMAVDVASYMQERIKTSGFTHEVRRFRRLRRRTLTGGSKKQQQQLSVNPEIQVTDDSEPEALFNAVFSLVLENVQIAWSMATVQSSHSGYRPEDLVFSIRSFDLSSKKKNTAKLRIEDAQLQMVPPYADRRRRSLNSALMPELVFNAAYFTSGKEVKLAFQAAGKSLDLRVRSDFMLPGSMLQQSIYSASQALREADFVSLTKSSLSESNNKQRKPFGNKRLRSVLVDVDFAGAIVTLQGRHGEGLQAALTAKMRGSRITEARYGQYVHGDAATAASLRAPGVALKVQFESKQNADPALNAELNVDASSNVLYPTVVPLVKQMTATVKEVMGSRHPSSPTDDGVKMQRRMSIPDKTPAGAPHVDVNSADAIIGKSRINVGLRIRRQEFSLSCRPVAKVSATTKFDGAYVTVNTVQSDEHGRFVALLASLNSLQASVKHVYSNESTASFHISSIVMSAMNSKHLGSMSGISAVLRVSPVTVALNAKQVQDLLLFREIWLPTTDEPGTSSAPSTPAESQAYVVQRYQQVASAPVFPWNTAIAVEKFEIQLDLGSTLGRSSLGIHDVWVSSKKTSDWEQTLCVNMGTLEIESKGRTGGTIELKELKARTSIQWPAETRDSDHTPLIQASAQFDLLQGKVSFDYQPFLAVDIAGLSFLMYNVRGISGKGKERLFSIVDGEKVFVYCTALAASQSITLFQAWQRLVQEKQAAYESSLREVARFMRRRSSAVTTARSEVRPREASEADDEEKEAPGGVEKAPISLQTTVVVTIKAIDAGVFPSTFFDSQVLKLEAFDAQARFAVSLEENRIHSALGLTLGHLGIALSGASRAAAATLEELMVKDIVHRAAHSRGGTILKVPRLVASMQTWQSPGSSHIDYVFTSSFEGKVDVGWNYSRIGFIRGMWENHSRALASRLGKPLQPLAVRITDGPSSSEDQDNNDGEKKQEQGKITAVVDVPQSRYTYTALTPPVIETPQLRDMGEATPPLEWIGLQREKLPNVTHQMIIVTLLEVAKEVEDAYEKILGSV